MSQLIDATSIASQFDRLPPHNIEAEMVTLAACLVDAVIAQECIAILRNRAEAFFQADHQIIFRELVAFYGSGKCPDAVQFREWLSSRGLLEEVGGKEYLHQIAGTLITPSEGPRYAKIVADKYLLRQMIAACNDGLKTAYSPCEDAQAAADGLAGQVLAITDSSAGMGAVAASEVVSDIAPVVMGERKIERGTATGWYDLDSMLLRMGFGGGDLIIIGARPSMGKTAVSFGMSVNMAVRGQPVAVFSLEMDKAIVTYRMVSWECEVPMMPMVRGMLSQEQRARASKAMDVIKAAPLYIDDTPALSPIEISMRLRSLHRKYHIKAAVIDYLQMMTLPQADSTNQAVGLATKLLKATARQLNIPIVLLSQLNRVSQQSTDKRPTMAQLRDSGNIEQDADVVILLHREDYYHKGEADYQPTNKLELIVDKQRNGPTNVVELLWVPECMKAKNLSEGV